MAMIQIMVKSLLATYRNESELAKGSGKGDYVYSAAKVARTKFVVNVYRH